MIDKARVAEENEARLESHRRDLGHSQEMLTRDGLDSEAVVIEVGRFSAAAPSWAVGTGGTRFARFPGHGEPRTTEEKLDDISALNSLTGANRTASLHVPWDEPEDPISLKQYAQMRGIGFDAMNSNTFQDHPSTTMKGGITYKFGSLSHNDPKVRKVAVEHNLNVIEIGQKLGSKALTIWLPDGTNHPGQASLRGQFERTQESLLQIYSVLPMDWRLFVEHKPFEPAFYSTVVNDWGSSLMLAQTLGDRALCLVDLGHHLPNTNIEQIVSRLAMAGKLGGFHFNDSKYGDDDVTAGSIKPFQLFLIFLELLEAGGGHMPKIAYMIDASHNLKDPLEDLIQSTDALQAALAQAACVDKQALADAQENNDPALASEVLNRAFRLDVRALVAEARIRNGAAIDPLAVFRAVGYRAEKIAERGSQARSTGL